MCWQRWQKFIGRGILSEPPNQSLQFVPALTGLHRTAFSPLRYVKAAAEYWRYVVGCFPVAQ